MEFSQNRAESHQNNNIIGSKNSDDLAKSERLQKAIARNRAKQKKRSGNVEETVGMNAHQVSEVSHFEPNETIRKSVGTLDNIEFSNEIITKKPISIIGRGTAKRKVKTKSKNKKDTKYIRFLVKASWFFCVFLMFRLVLSDGGVLDYYSSLNLLEERDSEYNMIIKENEELVSIIKKIKTNARYQRKLVRDNLGFIAKDEYLILFPKKKVSFSN